MSFRKFGMILFCLALTGTTLFTALHKMGQGLKWRSRPQEAVVPCMCRMC